MSSLCSVLPDSIPPVVISHIPAAPFRIRSPATYLFAFLDSEGGSGPTVVEVWLPTGWFRAGTTIVIANLSSPIFSISLSVYCGSSSTPQPAGFPVQMDPYQQQTFWWIPASGWMYAGGFLEKPALAKATSASCSSSTFVSGNQFGISTNAATLEPLCNATVFSIYGDGVNIIGQVNFSNATRPFTAIGPGDGTCWYPLDFEGSGQLAFSCNDGYNITGTVTVTLNVEKTGWQTTAIGSAVPAIETMQVRFSKCTVTSGNLGSGYITIQLSPYPERDDGLSYAPFVDSAGHEYTWYWTHYGTALPNYYVSLTVQNSTTHNSPIKTIQSTIDGTVWSATVNYSGVNVGDPSYAYTYPSFTYIGTPPQLSPPYPLLPHGLLGTNNITTSPPASTTVAGPTLANSLYPSTSTSVFNGFFTLSDLIPLPIQTSSDPYGGDILLTLEDNTQLTATVQWAQTIPASGLQNLTLIITGVVPPLG